MSDIENTAQEATEELLTDPDAPDKGNAAPPPQTTDAEPAEADKDGR